MIQRKTHALIRIKIQLKVINMLLENLRKTIFY